MGFKENPENINKNGRPKKGHTLTDILEKELSVKKSDGKIKKPQKELVVKSLLQLAIDKYIECPSCKKRFRYGGDLGALKYIFDRIDGKPIEHIKEEAEIGYYCIPPKKK